MLVSGPQQSHSVIHLYTDLYIIFYIFLRSVSFILLLQVTGYSSLCCILGPCWLSIYSSVDILIPNSLFIALPLLSLGNHNVVFYVCELISLL